MTVPRQLRAFALIEVVLVVAVIGVLGGLAYTGVTNARQATQDSKLQSDAATINQAIPLYLSFGGTFASTDTPQAVLEKLKTKRTTTSANVGVGPTSSFIDPRIFLQDPQTDAEASGSANRVIWTGTNFQVLSGPGQKGYKGFEFRAPSAVSAVVRKDDLQYADKTSGPRWVWDYQDAQPGTVAQGSTPGTGTRPTYPTPNPAATPTATPIAKVAVSPVISGPSSITYYQAGGVMADGSYSSSLSSLVYSVSGSIPNYLAGRVSMTATQGTQSSTGSDASSVSINLTVSSFNGASVLNATNSLTADSTYFTINNNPATYAVAASAVTLNAPVITAVQGSTGASFFISPGALSALPSGYVIRYTTDGSSLTTNTSGLVYSGSVALSSTTPTTIKAKTFPPSNLTNFFTASAESTLTYTPTASSSALPTGVLIGTLGALNSTFNGNIILAYNGNPQNITLNSGGYIKGSLYVPGTPTIYSNAKAGGKSWSTANDSLFSDVIQAQSQYVNPTDTSAYRVVDLGGNPSPSNYQITLNSSSSIYGKIYRQIERYTLTTLNTGTFPAQTGNTSVTIPQPSSGASYTPTTAANLTVNSGYSGGITLAAGSYGNYSINSGYLILGDASNPNNVLTYSFQSLTMNGGQGIVVVGKVILNIKNGFSQNNGITLGSSSHPEYLQINLWSGSYNGNGGSIYGALYAPGSQVTLNNITLNGAVTANQLQMNSGSQVFSLSPPTSATGQ